MSFTPASADAAPAFGPARNRRLELLEVYLTQALDRAFKAIPADALSEGFELEGPAATLWQQIFLRQVGRYYQAAIRDGVLVR